MTSAFGTPTLLLYGRSNGISDLIINWTVFWGGICDKRICSLGDWRVCCALMMVCACVAVGMSGSLCAEGHSLYTRGRRGNCMLVEHVEEYNHVCIEQWI